LFNAAESSAGEGPHGFSLSRVNDLKGATFEAEKSQRFEAIDGIYGLVQKEMGVLLVVGTTTRNGHFKRVAFSWVHGENKWAIETTLLAIERAAERIFPGIDSGCAWSMGDCSFAVQSALNRKRQTSPGLVEDEVVAEIPEPEIAVTLAEHKGKRKLRGLRKVVEKSTKKPKVAVAADVSSAEVTNHNGHRGLVLFM